MHIISYMWHYLGHLSSILETKTRRLSTLHSILDARAPTPVRHPSAEAELSYLMSDDATLKQPPTTLAGLPLVFHTRGLETRMCLRRGEEFDQGFYDSNGEFWFPSDDGLFHYMAIRRSGAAANVHSQRRRYQDFLEKGSRLFSGAH